MERWSPLFVVICVGGCRGENGERWLLFVLDGS